MTFDKIPDILLTAVEIPHISRFSIQVVTLKTVIGTLAADGWAVTFGTVSRDLGSLQPCPGPYSLYK